MVSEITMSKGVRETVTVRTILTRVTTVQAWHFSREDVTFSKAEWVGNTTSMKITRI